MNRFSKNIPRHGVIVFMIVAAIYIGNVFFFSPNRVVTNTRNNNKNTRVSNDAACRSCHKNVYDSYTHTAHFHTSAPASLDAIKGSFDSGKNTYTYNKFMYVQMDHVDDSFYQTAMINTLPFQSEPFDVVIGSGRKGQTFLYWNNSKLFQLPVSYYTAGHSWCNSPGYPTTLISFDRQVNAQCLECHGSYAKATSTTDAGSVFDTSTIIYGINCERCHGDADEHISYYTTHPHDTTSKFIIASKFLSRQQRLDACALCHSGLRKAIRPAFSFKVGDKLDDFSTPNYNEDSTAMLDVHGNQYGLLTASKCFRLSQLDCSSCHNVHASESSNMQVFSQRCMNCHNQTNHDTCTLNQRKGLTLSENCVDCHMPLLPSNKIFLELADRERSTADYVRTHRIAIYRNLKQPGKGKDH